MREAPRLHRLAGALALATLASPGGCVAVEAIAGAFSGSRSAEVPVEMRYAGLADRRLAVVAAIDPALARRQPDLGPTLEAVLAERFARHVPGASVLPPAAVTRWRRSHPYWETIPAGGVTEGLGVERVVRVEVAEFQTRPSGNAHVLEGLLDAAIQIYAAGGGPTLGDPDRPVFAERIRVRYPEDSELGIPQLGDSGDPGPGGIATPSGPDEALVARALLSSWIRRAGPLFYDQEQARKRDRERAKQRADAGAVSAGEAA